MPAPANTPANPAQDQFTIQAKIAMVKLGLNVTALARELGLNRNTVSLAINHKLYVPTRERIAARLGIPL